MAILDPVAGIVIRSSFRERGGEGKEGRKSRCGKERWGPGVLSDTSDMLDEVRLAAETG